MKKSFFGYNVKEVDDALGQLTSQNTSLIEHNDYMEEELKNLKQQLAEAKAAVADGMTKAELDNYKELKAAYAALRENANASAESSRKALQESEEARQQSESEAADLRAGLAAANAQITELQAKLATAINERDNLQGVNIGSFNRILENACREIAAAKDDSRQEMDNAIAAFNTQWSDAQAEMCERARKVSEINAGIRQKYEDLEKMIQERLADLETGDTDMSERLAGLETERINLSAALGDITDRLREK